MGEEKKKVGKRDNVYNHGAKETSDTKEVKETKDIRDKQEIDNLRLQLDEIMKTMFSTSPKVMIKMLNSLFEENYEPEKTEISLTNNEFVLEYQGYDIIRGDVFIRLQERQEKPNHYHIDFQTIYDGDMVIRMFAYGLSKARELSNSYKTKDETTIYIPKQLVIYMEKHREIKDKLTLRIVFPDGEEMKHEVSVMKYWEYRTADLLKKELYPLLPLQLFTLRRKLKRIKDRKSGTAEEQQEAINEAKGIINEVGAESRRLYDKKAITGEDYHKILLAMNNLFNYLNAKYGNIEQMNEEVGKMIKTLVDPVVKEEGIEEGIEKGFLIAKSETAIRQLTKKIGILPEETQEKLKKAEAETLNNILDDIFDLSSLQEVEKYLEHIH